MSVFILAGNVTTVSPLLLKTSKFIVNAQSVDTADSEELFDSNSNSIENDDNPTDSNEENYFNTEYDSDDIPEESVPNKGDNVTTGDTGYFTSSDIVQEGKTE